MLSDKDNIVVVLCIALDHNRVLIHREVPAGGAPGIWGITREEHIVGLDISPFFVASVLASNIFKLNPNKGDFGKASILKVGRSFVMPFIFRVQKNLEFRCPASSEYRTMCWKDLFNDLSTEIVKKETGVPCKYTDYSMHAIAQLHAQGHIG